MKTDKKSPEFNDELKGQEKNRALRPLIAASLAALSMGGAYASEQPQVPSDDKDNTSGLITEYLPGFNLPEEGRSYTLTKIQEGGEKPEGENILTRFIYNSQLDKMVPVYYKLNIELDSLTVGDGDAVKYFQWSLDTKNNTVLTSVDSPIEGKDTITVKYNSQSSGSVNAGSGFSDSIIGNYISDTVLVQDGADVKDIKGDFISGTDVFSSAGILGVLGGSTVDTIEANFVDNYSVYYGGGAIYNAGSINSISGNFINNRVNETNLISAEGGAIYNSSDISAIYGAFIGNYAYNNKKTKSTDASGGAIYNFNYAEINNISSEFINNYAYSVNGNSNGGAIYNTGNIASYNVSVDKIYRVELPKMIFTNIDTGETITVYERFKRLAGK